MTNTHTQVEMPRAEKIDDGGPAFARPVGSVNSADWNSDQEGMSLRDYFAAHSPSVPDWFRPELPARPKQPACRSIIANLPPEDPRKTAYSFINDGDEVPDELSAANPDAVSQALVWDEEMDAWRDAVTLWERERDMATIAQWRFAYADAMLRARKLGQ